MSRTLIETERCALRLWQMSDTETFEKLNGDPDVMRFIPIDLSGKAKTQQYISKHIKLFEQYNYCFWAVTDKETGRILGSAGLKPTDEEFGQGTEIGYRFFADTWGKGLATETAKAILKYGFEKINLEKIYALADEDNLGSVGVMKKVGMKYEKTFRPEENRYGKYVVRYVLKKEDC